MSFIKISTRYLLAIIMLTSLLWFSQSTGTVAYAQSTGSITISENIISIELRAERKEWKYRLVDGKTQKRLWSITYGKWLTDWEWA